MYEPIRIQSKDKKITNESINYKVSKGKTHHKKHNLSTYTNEIVTIVYFQSGVELSGTLAAWAPVLASQLHTSALLCRVVAGKYRITKKRDRPLTYEMANGPHYIAHRKSWNSWNTCEFSQTLPYHWLLICQANQLLAEQVQTFDWLIV